MNTLQLRYKQQIDELVEVCRRAGELGFGAGSGGNASYKVDKNTILITPTGTLKRKICFEDICIVDSDGGYIYVPEGKKPTGEAFMHLHIYKMRDDIKGIMHAHPPLVIGMSLTQEGADAMKLPLFPEASTFLGPIYTIPYVEPNCDDLGYSFDPYIMKSNGFIMANHGCLVCSANSIKDTVEEVQVLEATAKSVLAAKIFGGDIRILNDEELDGLDALLKQRGDRMPGPAGVFTGMKDMFKKA
jgi:L-fuculose-phosphate aldolase